MADDKKSESTETTEVAEVDDQKAKFLAALEAKKKAGKGPNAQKHEGEGSAHGEHAASGGKREFRRKSGG